MNSAENNSNALDYCINKAIPDGSNLYYATLFEESKNKHVLICLHALLNELAEIIRECSDPGIARIKLHWWEEEIERLFNEQARHPISRQIAKNLLLNDNLKTSLNLITNSFDDFIFIKPLETLESTLSSFASTAGEIWVQCSVQTHRSSAETLNSLRESGAVYHFLRCLQEPNTYITETRCIIPEDFITQSELLKLRLDLQNNSDEQANIFSPLLNELLNRLGQLHENLKMSDHAIDIHALILNRLAAKTCDEILNGGCKLLDTNTSLTPLRKLGLAWWTNIKTKT